MWGATSVHCDYRSRQRFQSTRPVWGATITLAKHRAIAKFQSTRPVWGATTITGLRTVLAVISIHAPRVGRDAAATLPGIVGNAFQSTRPVWGATMGAASYYESQRFQSTRPVWGATVSVIPRADCELISIHAPRVGRDSKFDDFTPSNLHKRYKRVLARPKNTREKGKIKQKLAYIHAFSAFLGCEGSGTFCALVLRTQYR